MPDMKPPLTQSGLRALVKTLRKDPEQWAQAIKLLASSPREAINQLFELTATQRLLFYAMSDDELTGYTQGILRVQSRLGKGEGLIVFTPDPVFAGAKAPPTTKGRKKTATSAAKMKVKCSCRIDIEW